MLGWPSNEMVHLPPSNEMRLSCAAVLCSSQMQFYYDGRRLLQSLFGCTGSDAPVDIDRIGGTSLMIPKKHCFRQRA